MKKKPTPTLAQRLKSLLRNARRQGGSQGPKSCASLAVEKRSRELEAAIAEALVPTPGETNPELEARRDLLAQARALYSTTWLASAARCTMRRAQQIMAQRLVWLARSGDMFGFPDLPALRQRAQQVQQASHGKVMTPCAGQAPVQLCLFQEGAV